MSVPRGWRLTRVPKSRLICSSTSHSQWLSAVFACHSRIFRYDSNYGVVTPPQAANPFNVALERLTVSGRASAGPEVPGAVG
jgi:hypothetical protein